MDLAGAYLVTGLVVLGLIVYLVILIFISVAIANAARNKGQSWALFFWLSLLVNWFIMLIVMLLIKRDPYQPHYEPGDLGSTPVPCEFCKEQIRADAIICKHCGKQVEPKLPSLIAAEREEAQRKAEAEIALAEAALAKQAAKEAQKAAARDTRQALLRKVYKSKLFRFSMIFLLGVALALSLFFVISSEISKINKMDIQSGISSCDSQITAQTTYLVDEANDKITITFAGEGLQDSDTRMWLNCVGTALAPNGVTESLSGTIMSKVYQNPDLKMVTIAYADLSATLSDSTKLEIYKVKSG